MGTKVVSSGVAASKELIRSWIAEAERKVEAADASGNNMNANYMRGRLDAYRDCLAVLNQ